MSKWQNDNDFIRTRCIQGNYRKKNYMKLTHAFRLRPTLPLWPGKWWYALTESTLPGRPPLSSSVFWLSWGGRRLWRWWRRCTDEDHPHPEVWAPGTASAARQEAATHPADDRHAGWRWRWWWSNQWWTSSSRGRLLKQRLSKDNALSLDDIDYCRILMLS